jgi:hypothetical protein
MTLNHQSNIQSDEYFIFTVWEDPICNTEHLVKSLDHLGLVDCGALCSYPLGGVSAAWSFVICPSWFAIVGGRWQVLVLLVHFYFIFILYFVRGFIYSSTRIGLAAYGFIYKYNSNYYLFHFSQSWAIIYLFNACSFSKRLAIMQ